MSSETNFHDIKLLAEGDARALRKAQESYGDSWSRRGGVGAFMMLARKWDRIENQVQQGDRNWDIFQTVYDDPGEVGILDDIRDLRRYLLLVEERCNRHLLVYGEDKLNPPKE